MLSVWVGGQVSRSTNDFVLAYTVLRLLLFRKRGVGICVQLSRLSPCLLLAVSFCLALSPVQLYSSTDIVMNSGSVAKNSEISTDPEVITENVETTVVAATTDVVVINAPNLPWAEKVRFHIKRVNHFLGTSFQGIPRKVRVFRTYGGPEYDISLGMIFVDEAHTPVEIYHEYAHNILDSYLTERSSAIKYYKLRHKLQGLSLLEAIDDIEAEIQDDRRLFQYLRENSYLNMANSLRRYMDSSSALLQEVKELVWLETQREGFEAMYERFLGHTAEPSLFELLGPYHELFADTLAVLITGRWNSILMTKLDLPNGAKSRYAFLQQQPEVLAAKWLEYRSFKEGVSLDNYTFSFLEAENNYSQFHPVRSYIRNLSDNLFNHAPENLLSLLADAIYEEVEERLNGSHRYQISLEQMNRQLNDRLASSIKKYQYQSQ